MMVDNSQLLSIFIAAATTLIYLVVTRRRREADAARGADVVVVLCGDKPRARELLFAIPAVTLYECATFGDQLRLTTSFSARRDECSEQLLQPRWPGPHVVIGGHEDHVVPAPELTQRGYQPTLK